MAARTLDEIEKAFREMGLNETTWGRQEASTVDAPPEPRSAGREQVFIRIQTTTTPVEKKDHADMA